jgi:GNAT superfamily N-acetyltransferase
MLSKTRNIVDKDGWIFGKVENNTLLKDFDCDDKDLNEYFRVDAINHKEQLLTQTYFLTHQATPNIIFGLLDFCNDAIELKSLKGKIPVPKKKQYKYWPAVKLTRFGILKQYQHKNVGTKALNIVKILFTTENRTGCRFITVDAYPNVIEFYQKCGFELLTEEDTDRDTRSMYFDLKRLQIS